MTGEVRLYSQLVKSSLSQQIAQNLEQMIIGQEIQVGDRLPGEIELAERFGTSRNVIREAITMLKERGLVDVKNGSGAYVAQLTSDALGSMVTRLTAVGSASPEDVYEIRMALEVRACGLAAQNATPQQKKELRLIVEDMGKNFEDLVKWKRDDMRFHRCLAQMTNNALFPAFIEPLAAELFSPGHDAERPPSREARLGGMEQHRRILDAVEQGNRTAAERAMTDHLQRYLDDILHKS